MRKIASSATASGKYNGNLVNVISNMVTVYLPDELSISKYANKSVWLDGLLTYKIKITNEASLPYDSLLVTDFLNPRLVTLVKKSITINDVLVDEKDYSFKAGILKIVLNNIDLDSEIIIKFKVRKLNDEYFVLENIAHLFYDESEIKSNKVIVTSLQCKKDKWIGCDKPYLG